MAIFNAKAVLSAGNAGPWGSAVSFSYDRRDVLLYAVGIGSDELRFVYEQHPEFAVFPTFPIRWGGAGTPVDRAAVPPSPGPLMIDAERCIEQLGPLPVTGSVSVISRLIGVHPRGNGSAFVETESKVMDAAGNVCVRIINGSFRRGVDRLGDIEPFEGSGQSYFSKVDMPERVPDVDVVAHIAGNQTHIYRLCGDYNPLHIDPLAAKSGGFDKPILHGLCTLGFAARLLLKALCAGDPALFRSLRLRFSSPVFPGDRLRLLAWHTAPGRVVFECRVDEKVVVSNAYFEYV